jgi:hypothetical protein
MFTTDREQLLGNLVDFTTTTYYCSWDSPNQWICYDLKELRLLPRGYSIRTNGSNTHYHLRTWVVEAANNADASDWVAFDRRENVCDLDSAHGHACFPISTQHPEPYHCVRLRNAGPTKSNDHHLYITGFELFGDLIFFQ